MKENEDITRRFFEALAHLIYLKKIKGVATFANRYNINRQNLYKLQKDMTRKIFQPAWLTFLVNDYGVSATWLLTGIGEIMEKTAN